MQYKYECKLLLLDYIDYELKGCKYGYVLEDYAGTKTAYCSACMAGYIPEEYAGFTDVPLERLFKTCKKQSSNPWGENCDYTGKHNFFNNF